jgi:hypothetical protein
MGMPVFVWLLSVFHVKSVYCSHFLKKTAKAGGLTKVSFWIEPKRDSKFTG